MDSLITEMEAGINRFITHCPLVESIITWSSLLKIEDVDELLTSTAPADANLVHGSVLSFYERIHKFKKEQPLPPTSSNVRGS